MPLPLRDKAGNKTLCNKTLWQQDALARLRHLRDIGCSRFFEGMTMRLLFVLVAAAGAFSAGARSQEALKLCQVIKDDGVRLMSYDELAGPRSAENGQKRVYHICGNKTTLEGIPMNAALIP